MVVRAASKLVLGTLKRLPLIAASATAGWVGYSVSRVDHHLPVSRPVPGKSRQVDVVGAGRVAVYEGDQHAGSPVVLVHGVHAAASAYDMRPLFTTLGWNRRVIAFDLPGYGESERGDRDYDPAMMTAALVGVLEKVAGEPADIVALSLGSEYAAAAALARPDLVRSLTLISPTGMDGQDRNDRSLPVLLRNPVLGQAFYDLLVTTPSIRWFLGRSFVGDVDPGFVAHARATSHQPGARFAPLAFISGRLFTRDVDEVVYRRITQPTLVLYDRDAYVDFDNLPEIVGDLPSWRAVRIPGTAGLPHFDRQTETVAAIETFWKDVDAE